MTQRVYSAEAFRLVRHGIDDVNAHCRHCSWAAFDGDVKAKARRHAKKELHTVDVYQTNWTEYTSYVSNSQKDLINRGK